jgi:hypothetical protein
VVVPELPLLVFVLELLPGPPVAPPLVPRLVEPPVPMLPPVLLPVPPELGLVLVPLGLTLLAPPPWLYPLLVPVSVPAPPPAPPPPWRLHPTNANAAHKITISFFILLSFLF